MSFREPFFWPHPFFKGKALGTRLMSLVYDFGQGLDVVCTLDTAAIIELWRLDLFSCTSSSFLCAGTLSPRGKYCYFLREV